MKVCYFGTCDGNYPRNKTIIKELKKNNVDVVICHMNLWRLNYAIKNKKYSQKYNRKI